MCRVFVWCLNVVFLLVTIPVSQANADVNNIDTDGVFSVFKVGKDGFPDEFVGTGLYIGDNVAVTAAHLFYRNGISYLTVVKDEYVLVSGRDTKSSDVYSFTGRYECPLENRDPSKNRDICFVEIDGIVDDKVTAYDVSCPVFSANPELYLAGYFFANGQVQESEPIRLQVQSVISGVTLIDELDIEVKDGYIQTQADTQVGSSGSPVFDALGRVAGVHSGEVDVQWFAPFSGMNSLTLGATGKRIFDSNQCIQNADEAIFEADGVEEGWAFSKQKVQDGSEWVIDLDFSFIEYAEGEISHSNIQIMSNNTDQPIRHLNRDQITEVFGELTSVNLSVRSLKSAGADSDFGLGEFSSFKEMGIESIVRLARRFYVSLEEEVGTIVARYSFERTENGVSTNSSAMSAVVAENKVDDFWVVMKNYDQLSVPILPGDYIVKVSQYKYEVTSNEYYSEFEKEQWGATPRFPMRNSVYVLDTSDVDARIDTRTFRALTRKSTGVFDFERFKEVERHDRDGAVVVHKNVPSSTLVGLQFSWR